jgi:hypothetical protein
MWTTVDICILHITNKVPFFRQDSLQKYTKEKGKRGEVGNDNMKGNLDGCKENKKQEEKYGKNNKDICSKKVRGKRTDVCIIHQLNRIS